MKNICILMLVWICVLPAVCQEKQRIAVSSTTGNADEGVRSEVEEALIEAIAQEGKYTLVERAKFSQVLQEQKLQISGFVVEEQIVEVGRLAGAQVLLLSNANFIGSYYKIRYRLVDVVSGSVLQKAAKDASVGNIRDVINAISQEPLWGNAEESNAQKICGLEIQPQDAGEYSLSKKEQRKKLPDSWRLPTVKELKCMCENKEKIGGFNYGDYWSNESNDGYGKGVRFNSCREIEIQLNASVRYVR